MMLSALMILAALPIVAVPAKTASPAFAIFISGDGGWAKIDKTISEELARSGIPVTGLNSLKYFWTKRTPDEFARDVGTLIDKNSARDVVLIGYSRGADVLPFADNRLAGSQRRR